MKVMMQKRHEMLTWEDVDKLIDHLIPQFEGEFDGMVIITRAHPVGCWPKRWGSLIS
jgi:hypothetical protein